jgi:hypothetical protein
MNPYGGKDGRFTDEMRFRLTWIRRRAQCPLSTFPRRTRGFFCPEAIPMTVGVSLKRWHVVRRDASFEK